MTSSPEAYRLARYIPSAFQSEIIETEIRALLPPCCKGERISVRVPMGIEPMYDNLRWHQDGGGPEGTTRHMVVWASEQPTDIVVMQRERFVQNIRMGNDAQGIHEAVRAHIATAYALPVTVQPFDVLWFNNDIAFHKQPENTRPYDRWFVSVRCSGVISV